jgi:phytoene dehydrogenase-like protein
MGRKEGSPSVDHAFTSSPPNEPSQYDAIVVGAGFGGLVSAAILAKEGKRVLVVETADRIGCVGGAHDFNGYWLPWARNWETGYGNGDLFLLMGRTELFGIEAAKRAGADIALSRQDVSMRVHLTPDGRERGPIILYDDQDPESVLRFGTEFLGMPKELLGRFQEEMGKLASLDSDENFDLTFDEYLPQIPEAEIRNAISTLATVQWSIPAGETSVGRYAAFLRGGVTSWRVNDPEVGGMQGLMEPFARVIRQHGGEILLGRHCLEIPIKDGAVTGVIVQDKTAIVTEYRSDNVICNHLYWQIFDLVDESLFPEEFVENARRLQSYSGDTACMNIGLERLPKRRTDGLIEDQAAWNRVVVGPERDYMSGWYIPSLVEEKSAPEGKHLLVIAWATSGPASPVHRPFESFADAREKLDRVFAYANGFYEDLESCIEWKNYKWCKAPSCAGYYWKNIRRAPVQAPNVEGLFLVSNAAEVEGIYQDIEANAGIQAADLILARTKA